MNRRHFLTLAALLPLAACNRDEHWHQRLTLVVETPSGPVTGHVVQRIDWQGATGLYKTATSGMDPSQTSTRVTGEALALEVAPGRWLFALLKGDKGWQGEPGLNAGYVIAVPKGHHARSAEGVDDILAHPKDTPLELPPEAWPMLVTFDDITKSETVRRVDPADLAAVFGAGVALKAVTLEVTGEVVTDGRVEGVLGWLKNLWPNMLDGQRYETIEANNRFANSINVGLFSSELGK
jgi:surface antigen